MSMIYKHSFRKMFVIKGIVSLYMRFTDLPIFNDANFLSILHYYEEINDRDSKMTIWLIYLCEKFSVGDSHIVDIDKCFSEMDEFMCTIYKSFPKKHIF